MNFLYHKSIARNFRKPIQDPFEIVKCDPTKIQKDLENFVKLFEAHEPDLSFQADNQIFQKHVNVKSIGKIFKKDNQEEVKERKSKFIQQYRQQLQNKPSDLNFEELQQVQREVKSFVKH